MGHTPLEWAQRFTSPQADRICTTATNISSAAVKVELVCTNNSMPVQKGPFAWLSTVGDIFIGG